jgi:hypothetical protein
MVSPDPVITIAGRSGNSAAHRPGYWSAFSSVMAAEPTGSVVDGRKRAEADYLQEARAARLAVTWAV